MPIFIAVSIHHRCCMAALQQRLNKWVGLYVWFKMAAKEEAQSEVEAETLGIVTIFRGLGLCEGNEEFY